MGSHRKLQFISASLLALLLFAAGVAIRGSQANECDPINTGITSTFANGSGCPSPVGICTTGTIAGGPLKGTTSFTALALIPGPAPSTMAYTGTLTIATDQGTLNISDVGVLDQANTVFSEIDRIQGGTGIFSGA